MLEVENLHAYYAKSHILQGVSFRVGAGEIVSLLGRNGAGRSTAVKTIIGQVPPVGAIRFRGERIDGMKPHEIARKGLGYVPEGREIFPTLTVRENLLLGMKSARQRGRWPLDDLLALFPLLRERIDAPGGVLSGGEQQMLTICRTLMGDPELIMVDEPTEGLSPQMVALVRALLEKIAGRGDRDPADRAEIDDRPRDLAAALRDGTGPHRVRGDRGAVARQSRRAQRVARSVTLSQRFASRIMLRAMTSRWISLVPS